MAEQEGEDSWPVERRQARGRGKTGECSGAPRESLKGARVPSFLQEKWGRGKRRRVANHGS